MAPEASEGPRVRFGTTKFSSTPSASSVTSTEDTASTASSSSSSGGEDATSETASGSEEEEEESEDEDDDDEVRKSCCVIFREEEGLECECSKCCSSCNGCWTKCLRAFRKSRRTERPQSKGEPPPPLHQHQTVAVHRSGSKCPPEVVLGCLRWILGIRHRICQKLEFRENGKGQEQTNISSSGSGWTPISVGRRGRG